MYLHCGNCGLDDASCQCEVDVCEWSRPSVDMSGAFYCVRVDEAHLKICENQRDD